MRTKTGLSILMLLALMTSIPIAFATSYSLSQDVNPSTIPANGMITFTVSCDVKFDAISPLTVTDPNGIVYTYQGAYPQDTYSWTIQFGTGVAGWSPAASTAVPGDYYIYGWVDIIIGGPHNLHSKVVVNGDFWQTPEFESIIAASSLGLVGIALIKRRKSTAI